MREYLVIHMGELLLHVLPGPGYKWGNGRPSHGSARRKQSLRKGGSKDISSIFVDAS